MPSIRSFLRVFIAFIAVAHAAPTNQSSEIQHGLARRELFNVDDISVEADKKFLREAQKEAVEIPDTVLKNMDKPKYQEVRKRWFGTGSNVQDDVRGVCTNFVGLNIADEGAAILSEVNVWHDDYWIDRASGKRFCDRTNAQGKTPVAYYKPRNKQPGMHYCDKFFKRQGRQEYLRLEEKKCPQVGRQINTATTGGLYRGANVLHEFMHVPKVGPLQIGEDMADHRYGAFSCYTFKDSKAKNNGVLIKPTSNADTYVFHAMHIWLTEVCGGEFSYPGSILDD